MNEKLRILKLLEEGKINANEAARLLEALSHPGHRRRKFKMWHSFDSIPEVVASAVATHFEHFGVEESLQFPKKDKVVFNGISGDLTIAGGAQDMIDIEKDGFVKINEKDSVLEIKAISGDMKITAPSTTDFVIKGVSGDLKISNLNSKIEIASVSGDIGGKELSGSLIGDFISGDVDLGYNQAEIIKIKSKSGDIILRLSKKIDAEIEIEAEYGNIDCDFKLRNEKKEKNKLRGIINKPKAKIKIVNEHGNVAIKKHEQ